MSWLWQTVAFGGIALLCALGTRFIAGEYDRSVPCHPNSIEKYEVCLKTVMEDWKGDVLWVDARGRKDGKLLIKGAVEIDETHLDEDLNKVAQQIFRANNAGRKAVVFCETDACGSSKFVREKLLSNMLHEDVYVLFGGWKAIKADGSLLKK